MPLVSKTVEVSASAETIMAIVADFEAYPQWNEEIKGCWILARYPDGRPSQLRLDVVVQGQAGTFITAVYYPGENQIFRDMYDQQLAVTISKGHGIGLADVLTRQPTIRRAKASMTKAT